MKITNFPRPDLIGSVELHTPGEEMDDLIKKSRTCYIFDRGRVLECDLEDLPPLRLADEGRMW